MTILDNVTVSGVVTGTIKNDDILRVYDDKFDYGFSYRIESLGSTDFTRIGAFNNAVGELFVSNLAKRVRSFQSFQSTVIPADNINKSVANSFVSQIFSIDDSTLIYDQTHLGTATQLISAGDFVTGKTYQIKSLGTTDFTKVGAKTNTVGCIFIASGTGVGVAGSATTKTAVSTFTYENNNGKTYTIVEVGTTDFTKIGAFNNKVGTTFKARLLDNISPATGTGVVEETVSAGEFITGKTYVIKTVGVTDFTRVGSLDNFTGTSFVATGNGGVGSAEITIMAGDFVAGQTYTIRSLGITDFTTIGASSNTVSNTFTASNAGTPGIALRAYKVAGDPNWTYGRNLLIGSTTGLSDGMFIKFDTGVLQSDGTTYAIVARDVYKVSSIGMAPNHFLITEVDNTPVTFDISLSNLNIRFTAISNQSPRPPNEGDLRGNIKGTEVVYDDTHASMQIDYTPYYERIATSLESLVTLAQTGGIHVTRPYEWASVASLIKYYQENGINLADFKKIVDSLPKQDGF